MNPNPDMARKILVVDDNESIRTFLCQALKQAGFEDVTGAPNGREGLDLCSRFQFDLVVCDIVMPEVDGLEMIFTLRRISPATRVIAISGGGKVDEKIYLDMAAKAGAETLVKPFDPPVLIEMIRRQFNITAAGKP